MSQSDRTEAVWVDRFLSDANRSGRWLLARPAWVIVALLVFASLIRNGIVVWNWFELSPFLLTGWDAPGSAYQSNALLNALATGWSSVGLDPTSLIWQLSQIVVTVAAFAVISALVLRRTQGESGYLPLALILSSGIAAVLWREIGRYDALFLIGMAFALLAGGRILPWIGVAVAVLTSPEQALVAAGLLVLLALLPFFREWLRPGLQLLAGSVVALSLIQLWFTVSGDPFATRIGVLLKHMSGQTIEAASAYDTKQSFVQFTIEKAMVSFSAGTALVWSILGMTVLVLLFMVVAQRSWWQGAYLIMVAAGIPVVVSFVFGEDRTRDASLVAVGVIVALAVTGSRRLAAVTAKLPGDAGVWIIWLAVLVSIVPLTYFYLDAEEPWRWAKELLVSLNNGVALPIDGSAR